MLRHLFLAIAVGTACIQQPAEPPCSDAPAVRQAVQPIPQLTNPTGEVNLLELNFVGACDESRIGYVDLEFLHHDPTVTAIPEERIISGIDPMPIREVLHEYHLVDEKGRMLKTQGPGVVTQRQYSGAIALSRIIFTPYDAHDWGTPDAHNMLLPPHASRSIIVKGVVRKDASPGKYFLKVREVRIWRGGQIYTFPKGVVRGPTIEITGEVSQR